MEKSGTKTRPTEDSATAFIDAVPDEAQRADARKIAAMMERLSGHKPKLWGAGVIGFGSYHYEYDSGRAGKWFRIGFSPRKGQTVLYLVDGFLGYAKLPAKLGKHKTGKSCLYVKRLSDIDEAVLEQLCVESLAFMAEKHPE